MTILELDNRLRKELTKIQADLEQVLRNFEQHDAPEHVYKANLHIIEALEDLV
jgi:hypothetical protein